MMFQTEKNALNVASIENGREIESKNITAMRRVRDVRSGMAVFLLLPIVKICGILLPVLPILAYAAAFACFFRSFAHAGE